MKNLKKIVCRKELCWRRNFENKYRLILVVAFMLIGFSPIQPQSVKTIRIGEEVPYTDKYVIKRYSLDMNELYHKNLKVITYNVIFKGDDDHYERIVLVSVLPDLISGECWQKIDTLCNPLDEVLIEDFRYLFVPNVGYVNDQMSNVERKFYNTYQVVMEKDGDVYRSTKCLLELFEIKSVDDIFPSRYGQLNIQAKRINISSYIALFKKFYPHYNPALSGYVDNSKKLNSHEWWRYWKDYLSEEVKIRSDTGYKFWTTSFNNSDHIVDYTRGVERLIYVPNKGIVAGSYDFYFKQLLEGFPRSGDKQNDLLFSNMMEEKVAIASELLH